MSIQVSGWLQNSKEDRNSPISDELNIKRNHECHFQMQLKMFMCYVQEGDFFMYTNEDYFRLIIRYDELFMTNLLSILNLKLERIFLPKIVSRRSEEIVNDRQLICKCRRPEFGQMITCELPKCAIGWYHYSCVDTTRVPRGSWMCGPPKTTTG